MRILLLGGTGAIGRNLVSVLEKTDHEVFVTSRTPHENANNVTYLLGNAHSDDFLGNVLRSAPGGKWDAIVDFMSYKTAEFRNKSDLLLKSARQYVFISSARVYANQEHPIKESSPRLLDVCTDEDYLRTDEYALTKARQEDILLQGGRKNFTIIRPYITYSGERLQLGVMEKEEWLYRALHGRAVLFPVEMLDCHTTMTDGADVAYGIYKVIGAEEAMGEIFHVTNACLLTWREIFEIYRTCMEEISGLPLRLKLIPMEKFLGLRDASLVYQVVYDRLFDRDFDTSKESMIVDVSKFVSPQDGLKKSLSQFVHASPPRWRSINWVHEASKDRLSGEHTPLSEISGIRNKMKYFINRYIKK